MVQDISSGFGFGDYIVANNSFSDRENAVHWDKDEIALVFSRRKRAQAADKANQRYDLLFENGRTAFGVNAETVHRHFSVLYRDPDVVIDGCSTNHGWNLAREALRRKI